MMNRKYLLGLFSIFFITIIFAGRNRVLWDFGVIINTTVQQRSEKNMDSLSNSEIESFRIEGLLADPFIPPNLFSPYEKVYDTPIVLESFGEVSINNISQVKLLASRLTMNINYQAIIDMISKIDFSKLNKHDALDLNYWLANAFFYTGKYAKSEDLILSNIAFAIDGRFHFLLAMTYESQGKIKDAQKEYLELIKQFPKSDYKVASLIKARMLGLR